MCRGYQIYALPLTSHNPLSDTQENENLFSSRETLIKAGQAASETIGTSWADRMPEVVKKYREIIEDYASAGPKLV